MYSNRIVGARRRYVYINSIPFISQLISTKRSGEDEGEEACWEDTDEELELEGVTKTRNARTTRTKRLAKQDQDLGIVHCKERWTNAGPDSRKKMFGMYAASGIVASFCRHGFLLLLCDMIRSGERCDPVFFSLANSDADLLSGGSTPWLLQNG